MMHSNHLARFQPRLKKLPVIGLCTALLLISGCTTNTRVSSNWLDQSGAGQPYQRLLVVALTEEGDKRMSFEDELALELNTDTTRAWASSRLMDISLTVNEDTIAPVVSEINADAVVVTLVADMQVRTVDTAPYTDVTARRKPGTAFSYDYIETERPSVIRAEFSIELNTDVVDVKSGETVYTMQSITTNQDSMGGIINEMTGAIAKHLKADGITR